MRDRVRPGLLPEAHRLKVQEFAVSHFGKQELIYSKIRIPHPNDDDDLFEGILLTLHHRVPMPEFHLVARALPDKRWSGLETVNTFYHHQANLQLWPNHLLYVSHRTDPSHSLLSSILDRHFRIANQFDPTARLLSSICDGHQTQLAIRCNYGFSRVGGLVLASQRLEAQVKSLMHDFSIIYASLGLLLEAESLIASKTAD
ncbi:hypothetical protein GCM10007315_11180 [Gemmobacter tilapiae]|uniref:Uncharacterized protein n=2 Tax=Neogemmobacter tilapiae TaxID=875041 RepID=A0A918TK26_9RHOB|nr:hypothetical protein GCM10007315_11180 [Gemmobacter tilapiae]